METLLLIDDDSRNIFALKAVLKSRAIACVGVASASEGLAILDDDPSISMVLLDMMMPDMDGYEAIAQIRRGKRGNVPIVAVTAQVMIGDKEKCIQAGADAYISKPIDVDLLMDVIRGFVKR
jgi:CheY-like chemotaxis protein